MNFGPSYTCQSLAPYCLPNTYFGISLGTPVPIMMKFCEDQAFVRERVIKAMQSEEIWCRNLRGNSPG